MVAIKSTVGNDENSSGVWMNSAVIRIRIDSVIEMASDRSSSIGGSGRISTTRIASTPKASAKSPRLSSTPISPMVGNLNLSVVGADAAVVVSLIRADLPYQLPPCPGRPGLEGSQCKRHQTDSAAVTDAGKASQKEREAPYPGNICPFYG